MAGKETIKTLRFHVHKLRKRDTMDKTYFAKTFSFCWSRESAFAYEIEVPPVEIFNFAYT